MLNFLKKRKPQPEVKTLETEIKKDVSEDTREKSDRLYFELTGKHLYEIKENN